METTHLGYNGVKLFVYYFGFKIKNVSELGRCGLGQCSALWDSLVDLVCVDFVCVDLTCVSLVWDDLGPLH